MSDTSGSQSVDAPRNGPVEGEPAESTQDGWTAAEQTEQTQQSPEKPYDVPGGAQQYGQPPATGYQPPETEHPGQWAPVQGNGPQQYGQPEHGQASYAQEGFPAPGTGPGGYEPVDPGHGQPPATGTPEPGAPPQGYAPQAPAYEQQAYAGQPQPYAQQHHPGQQAYAGQQPYPGQGYPPQAYAAPAPMSESDQRLWATLTHLSTLVVGFVGPLVAYLLLKDRSPFLKESTLEALNFSITVSLAVFVSSILALVLIGYVLLPVVYVGAVVLCILAAIAANKGEVYRYPLSWRLVR